MISHTPLPLRTSMTFVFQMEYCLPFSKMRPTGFKNYYAHERLQDGHVNAPRDRYRRPSSSASTSNHDNGLSDLFSSGQDQGIPIRSRINNSNNIVSGFEAPPAGSDNENRRLTGGIIVEDEISEQISSLSSSTEHQRSRSANQQVLPHECCDLPWQTRDRSFGIDQIAGVQGSVDVSDEDELQIAHTSTYRHNRHTQTHQQFQRNIDCIPSPNDDYDNFERRPILSSSSIAVGETRENRISSENHREMIREYAPSVNDASNFHHRSNGLACSSLPRLGGPTNNSSDIVNPAFTESVQGNIGGTTDINDGISQIEGSVTSSVSSEEISSSTRGGSLEREVRRNSGRRFWDALTRAASHRRTSSPITIVAIEEIDEHGSSSRWNLQQWRAGSEGDHSADNGGFALGRSLDFEERRRRVRSQVWALQRLSSGLEGLPTHSRNCPAGGQSGGYCSCEGSSLAEDTTTRASISRIIMLAEALFEVLDEIHRQSVALSRSASASLSSLPAPDSVVDSFPIRIHSKMDDLVNVGDEAAQCYICLVEYEEGDQVRVLPCHHDYHKGCVDKWLKEVHRVCPLCRGNVCETT
ncbi:hypothetical protein O6H91_07G135800 [Diphasiastrum complanatum]|uniref:Uncharacterized protein n=2 Tax=Diphasiastrum complanatum TaxID=34168 RepID=A0ACC2DA33_DIPCM|nr:hypothetical protein O6H91_07G135800 [Diphasiastrum complanatum]KAJ7551127.1 hypothetical protein O6H91_07G135800 [Diphasiastrum complanatum]